MNKESCTSVQIKKVQTTPIAMKSIYQNPPRGTLPNLADHAIIESDPRFLPNIFEDFSHRAYAEPAIKFLSESTEPALNPQFLTLRL